MKLNTLKDIQILKGKKVLLRVDFNVPLNDKGEVEDDSRIQGSLPTINFLCEHGAKVIILSHLGRPKGEIKEEFRLTKISKYLSKLTKFPVKQSDEILGEKTNKLISDMDEGDIVFLENIRFEKGEEECDENFTKELASIGDIFVNDAFGTAHREHASTAGVARHLKAYAGLLMEKEITALSPILDEEQEKPLTLIFGGAKIDTKIGIIENFIKKADIFLLGGGLANTFLAAAGYNVGESLYEEDKLETAREIMLKCEENKTRLVLPNDVIVASEIKKGVDTLNIPIEDVIGDMKILDIGTYSAGHFADLIRESKTIIWNGPIGLYEMEEFREGSRMVAEAIADNKGKSIVGGGDTADCITKLGISEDKFTHISTGGGACLEFLSGLKLPGIVCLQKQN